MTAKELREYGLVLGNIVGVHSMNKEELLTAIKEAIGITDESGSKLFAKEIAKVKVEIKSLKAGREKAREDGDKKQVEILRKRIGRLKKKTRRLSAAG
ncbi:MAG: transcription termination factor Rho [Desulfarculaceae bacterium]|nr:transcription termination factor Rho [Desulfarculaceae bacterium]MCF8049016.1 transcription termination factor Rho [Desulfarculaceae bacterium]MCF8066176.1 transcription termination factor Rho [Desulfarculaceae bacterium]MCF8097860.1 transcription termination factor Rho [Desulfarculaceae bacterium]MCF8122798.1 transcription termination factor Rho [Desulfarculaceae bacterium]